jgi:hypothetical protein
MDSKRTRGRMRRTHAVRGDPRGVAARQVRTLDGAGSASCLDRSPCCPAVRLLPHMSGPMDSKRTRERMRRTHAVRGDPRGVAARGRCPPWMERGAASRLDRSACCPAVRLLPQMSGPADAKRTGGGAHGSRRDTWSCAAGRNTGCVGERVGRARWTSGRDERPGRAGGTSGREDRRARGGEGRDEGTRRRTGRAGGTTAA